jgi:predicted flap endonuclease-1-like 5' DNA nuclease
MLRISLFPRIFVKGKRFKTKEATIVSHPPIGETFTRRRSRSRITLTDVNGIGQKYSRKLRNIGIYSVDDLARYNSRILAESVGISERIVIKWIENAQELLSMK